MLAALQPHDRQAQPAVGPRPEATRLCHNVQLPARACRTAQQGRLSQLVPAFLAQVVPWGRFELKLPLRGSARRSPHAHTTQRFCPQGFCVLVSTEGSTLTRAL